MQTPRIVDLARICLDEVVQRIGHQNITVPSLSDHPLSLWGAVSYMARSDFTRFYGLQVPSLRGFQVKEPSERFERAIIEIEYELTRLDPEGKASEAFLKWCQANIRPRGYYDEELFGSGEPSWEVAVTGFPGFDAQVSWATRSSLTEARDHARDPTARNTSDDFKCRRCNVRYEDGTLVSSQFGFLCLHHARQDVRNSQLKIGLPLTLLFWLVLGAIGYGLWYFLWMLAPTHLYILLH